MINVSLLVKVVAGFALLTGVISSCAGLNTQDSDPVTSDSTKMPTAAIPPAESKEPIRVDANGEVPFYARFGENETFSDGEWTVIVFYRSPDCIPPDFNLNQFFHFPSEDNPGAFACAPPTTTSVEYWANGPQTDPAPLIAEMTGRGAVPVWFFSQTEMETALADGVMTIDELTGLSSRLVGTAATYTELLHPSQSNAQTLIQFTAEGTLEDDRSFMVNVSYGAPDVDDHTTIEIQ